MEVSRDKIITRFSLGVPGVGWFWMTMTEKNETPRHSKANNKGGSLMNTNNETPDERKNEWTGSSFIGLTVSMCTHTTNRSSNNIFVIFVLFKCCVG
jgi:hypothetical protein